jgi:hypothetical protein
MMQEGWYGIVGGVFKAPASLCNVPQGFGRKTSGLLNGNSFV